MRKEKSGIERLRELIDILMEGGKIKGMPLAPAAVYECVCAYETVRKGKPFEFISEDVKKVLDRCGIETKEKGIGWTTK